MHMLIAFFFWCGVTPLLLCLIVVLKNVFCFLMSINSLDSGPARRLLVLGTQTLSVLTVVSYVQDQFRHQVRPAPMLVSQCFAYVRMYACTATA